MRLADIASVKARLDDTGSANDAVLNSFIDAVSLQFESFTRRLAEDASAVVEKIRLQPYQQTVELNHAPISAVSSVKAATNPNDLAAATDLDTENFYIDTVPGVVELLVKYPLGTWLQITYDGGMAVDTAAFVTAYPEIATSVEDEVVNRWRRRTTPAGDLSFEGGSTAFATPAISLLDGTKEVWNRYRRKRW